jgi:hypothetical protein
MRGFGVNTYGSIEPDARTWVLPRLEDLTDEQLVELDEYLLAGPSRQLLDPADLPWESGTFHLFVSHTHTYAPLAGKDAYVLQAVAAVPVGVVAEQLLVQPGPFFCSQELAPPLDPLGLSLGVLRRSGDRAVQESRHPVRSLRRGIPNLELRHTSRVTVGQEPDAESTLKGVTAPNDEAALSRRLQHDPEALVGVWAVARAP